MKHKIIDFGIQQMNTTEMTQENGGGHLYLVEFNCSRSKYRQASHPSKYYYWNIDQQCQKGRNTATPYEFTE